MTSRTDVMDLLFFVSYKSSAVDKGLVTNTVSAKGPARLMKAKADNKSKSIQFKSR